MICHFDWLSYLFPETGPIITEAPPAELTERYKIGRLIGEGNFAVVKECLHRLVTLVTENRRFKLVLVDSFRETKCLSNKFWYLRHMMIGDNTILSYRLRGNLLLRNEFLAYSKLFLCILKTYGGGGGRWHQNLISNNNPCDTLLK